MTPQTNLTENVLVSSEWLDKLVSIVSFIVDKHRYSFHPEVIAGMEAALAMPPFVQSERDVKLAGNAIAREMGIIHETDTTFWECRNKEAQAAINALAYKK